LNPANVLIICGAGLVSGKEIMTLELARGLKSADLSIHVLTSIWGSPAFFARLEEAELAFNKLPLGFISATLTLQTMEWTYGQLERWPDLLAGYMSLLQTQQPRKVIHTNWQHLLLLLPYLRPDRDLFWVHEVIPDKRQYRLLFQMLNRRLQCFIPVSNAVGESLRRMGIPDQKIRVIHNGLTDPAKGIERSGRSNGRIKLGVAGQINRGKGHDDLLEAFSHVNTRWPDIELHIFGRGADDYEHQLRERLSELELDDKVSWHGFVSDRAAIFNNLDICVVPSRIADSLPTVAIEAAGFGVPVIGTQRGGLPEIIEDGITGILVPPNDPAALATGIQQLLADPQLRLSMGVKARQHMLNRFSRERFINDFLSLLEMPTVDKRKAESPC
jgi:L-malate glycosyltransferase